MREEPGMADNGKVFIHATISLDGFIADVTGGLDWAFGFRGLSAADVRAITDEIGAVVAGRRGYDLGMLREEKAYGGTWTGPQFVLTHHPEDEVADPSITFVSGGIGSAIELAQQAAGGKSVVVFGATLAQQALAAGLIDEVLLHVVPILLGDGIALFARPADQRVVLEPVSVTTSGQITTLRYQVAQ
jgi:dihydrofolate reductase